MAKVNYSVWWPPKVNFRVKTPINNLLVNNQFNNAIQFHGRGVGSQDGRAHHYKVGSILSNEKKIN